METLIGLGDTVAVSNPLIAGFRAVLPGSFAAA
jgi:hypothetical protein